MKKNIVWLASYPKSGNTWFRSFLSSLLHEKEVDINDIEEGKIFSRRNILENTLDVDSTLLSENEIRTLQPLVFGYMNRLSEDKIYVKIHDSFIRNTNGTSNLPEDETLCAIYLVRNPLDVCISYANHNATTIDSTIQDMNNEAFKIGSDSSIQVLQPLLSWKSHYLSWLTLPNFPVYVIRYEDMLSDPFNVFKNILQNVGLNFSDLAIQKAIENTSFEKLKKQEEVHGFKGKNPKSPRFFNNGTSGTWKGKLSVEQINKIIADHGEVMRKLGYL